MKCGIFVFKSIQPADLNFRFYALETGELKSEVVIVPKILKQMEQYYINEFRSELDVSRMLLGESIIRKVVVVEKGG